MRSPHQKPNQINKPTFRDDVLTVCKPRRSRSYTMSRALSLAFDHLCLTGFIYDLPRIFPSIVNLCITAKISAYEKRRQNRTAKEQQKVIHGARYRCERQTEIAIPMCGDVAIMQ